MERLDRHFEQTKKFAFEELELSRLPQNKLSSEIRVQKTIQASPAHQSADIEIFMSVCNDRFSSCEF